MTMMDVNIAKFEIPIHIRKVFDQGKIDKVYEAMYLLADELAAIDTKRYMAKKPSEYFEEKIQEMRGTDAKKTSWSSRVSKQIFSYRERRFKYHVDNMYRVLELYVRSKTKGNGA
jgi:hypothetical protein